MGPRRVFAALFTVAILIAGSRDAGAQVLPAAFPSATAVDSPEAAVGEAIQATNSAYAGDCAGATPANDGQICSKYVADHGQVRAYLVGLTFSEFTSWVFVQQTPSGWLPMAAAPFDDSATSLQIPWPSA